MLVTILTTTHEKIEETNINDILPILILIFGAIFALGLGYLLYKRKTDNRLWNGKGVKYKNQTLNRIFIAIYQYLKEFPITRGYIEKLSYRYRMISPCDSKIIARKTVSICFISWFISLLAFVLIYMSNQQLITLIIVAFTIILVNLEVVGRMAKKFEIDMLNDMQKMLAEVQHFFYVEHRVDDALHRARETLSPNMRVAVDQIYELLLSEDKEKAIREYYDNIPNKYLRAFVSQCVGVMERGDQMVNGKFLFIKNLENLQREIDIEIDKLQRLNMEFLGVIVCVVAPIFCIDFVKQFAISLKENMESFYYGQKGFLLDIGLIIIISCIYFIMRKSAEYASFYQSRHRWLFRLDRIPLIKKAMDNYCDKYASKVERLRRELRNCGNNIRARHFILRSFILSGVVLLTSISLTFYLQHLARNQLINVKANDVEMLTSAATERQYEGMAEVIKKNVSEYIENPGPTPSVENVSNKLRKEGTYYNQVIADAMARDIVNRIDDYKNQTFSSVNLLICFCLSVIAYYLPSLMMKYSSTVSKDAMEDEVNQFNALISMLMYNDSMTVKQILEEMESFAVVFKQSLQICINDYGSGDLEALNALKEREPYEPFRRIIDNLIRCDDMPIVQAFDEINVDRDGYMAKRKLANEKSIRKRVFRAYVLAALPFILLFAYGLMPALVSSMRELNQLIEELENTAW